MNKAIPFLDIKPAYLELKDELDAAYQRVMASGWYILGQQLEAFEVEFAQYCGVDYCVGVSNGLDALRLLLLAYDIGPGDEVIVPSNTFIATWLSVSQTGATPIPVEPDIHSYNIDPDRIVESITKRTKAIVPVHLYGQPADMDSLRAVAESRGILLIEDAAQAQGAAYKGCKTGSLGDAAAFSFYPGKNLGAMGDAGAVTTNDKHIADKVRILGNYGSEIKYQYQVQGYNARLDELQAAFLRVKLKVLDDWNQRRLILVKQYQQLLAGHSCLVLPCALATAQSAWHLFTVRLEQRDALLQHLHNSAIGALVHYPIPPHLTDAYAPMINSGNFPIAETIANTTLSLPLGPHMELDQVRKVSESVIEFLSENRP